MSFLVQFGFRPRIFNASSLLIDPRTVLELSLKKPPPLALLLKKILYRYIILKILNNLFCKAPAIRAKNGMESKYLPAKNKTIMTKIDPIMVETLKKLEKVFDLVLANNQKKPYTSKKINMPTNIKFISNDDHT